MERPSSSSFLEDSHTPKTVAELYKLIGWNGYHTTLFIVCGFCWMADAVETGLLAYLKIKVADWGGASTLMLTMLQTMVFVGEFIGSVIWGSLADRYGRRWAFFASNLGLVTAGILSAFSPSLLWLIAFRFLCGICIPGITVAFDTLLEWVDESKTTEVGIAIEIFWTAGTIFVSIAAAVILPSNFGTFQPWRVLCLACAFPIFLACIGFFFLEESPMWLQDVGREREAMEVLRRVARRSRMDLTGFSLMPYSRGEEPAMTEVIRQPYLRRSICLSTIWLFSLLGYYGSSLATPQIFASGGGNVNFGELVFSSSGEFCGIILVYLMCRCGGYVMTMVVAAYIASAFIFAILSRNLVPLFVTAGFTFLLRALVMANSAAMYVATPLAYPTSIRCSGHAFANLWGRVGGIIASVVDSAPFNIQLITYATANIITGTVALVEGRHLEHHEEIFSVLVSDQRSIASSRLTVSRLSGLCSSNPIEASTLSQPHQIN